jgi:hypothetical protein
LRQGLVQVKGEFLGRLVEEEFEEFLAKLKLLLGGGAGAVPGEFEASG